MKLVPEKGSPPILCLIRNRSHKCEAFEHVPNNKALTKTDLSGLVNSLIGEGSGTRNDTNSASLVNKSRHDTNLGLAGTNQTGAVACIKSVSPLP